MPGFAKRHSVNKVAPKAAATRLLELIDDPDLKPAIESGREMRYDVWVDYLTRLRGTLTGVANGTIVVGTGYLEDPLSALTSYAQRQFRRQFFTSVTACRKDPYAKPDDSHLAQEITPEDGGTTYRKWADKGFNDYYSHSPRDASRCIAEHQHIKVFRDEDYKAVKTKVDGLIEAIQQVYAAGICAAGNPLQSKQRSVTD